MEFIHGLETAALDDKEIGLDTEALERLQHPPQHQIEVPSSDVCLAVDLYLAIENASQDIYNAVRTAILHRHPESELLSYAQTKTKIAQMTGITPLIHDMCVNSCLAYTGPFSGTTRLSSKTVVARSRNLSKNSIQYLMAYNCKHYGNIQIVLQTSNTVIFAQQRLLMSLNAVMGS